MHKKTLALAVICCFGLVVFSGCKNSNVGKAEQQQEDKKVADPNTLAAAKPVDVQTQKKISELEAQLAGKPNDFITLGLLAEVNQGVDISKAETLIDKAIAISPNDPWILRLKGDISNTAGKPDTVEIYQKAIAIIDKDKSASHKAEKGFAYLGIARYYVKQNDKVKALENAQKALAVNKDDKYMADFVKELQK